MQKIPLGTEESEYHYREASGESFSNARVEPPYWWVGMAERQLEILIYDRNVRDWEPSIDYPGITLVKTTRLENPNYLFLLLEVEPTTQVGTFLIELKAPDGKGDKTYPYELKARDNRPKAQGVTSADFIYLIMPDRFANGDKGNDKGKGMLQQGINRDKVFFRHGGDLIGVMEHLDYLEELGATALWLNPVLENDQPYESYHGYAVTDHYAIDSRLGTNQQYQQLVNLAHARGQKVIMDVIFNHTGDEHWFIKDLPATDWIHQWQDGYKDISYRAPVHLDPYAAKSDFVQVTESWFDKHMPDLNQQHPQLANYLIQNSIWWTEYSGQDGFRIDTYAYCDQGFMSEWNRRMLKEYPDLGIFAETWVHGTGVQSWFAEGERSNSHDSHLPGVTDFQMYYALQEALTQTQGWTSGVARIYYTLAQDYLYKDPYRNVLFLDNHDLGRIYGVIGEDLEKFKSAISLLLTLRGIPMIYYGTEILMTGTGGAFGEGGRRDFPGGFPRDKEDKFKASDRTADEQAAFDCIKTLANYRKENPVLQSGQLTQYIPANGIYVFFRYDEEKTVMIAFNSNETAATLSTDRFAEQIKEAVSGTNLVTGERIEEIATISLRAFETLVLELE
ncbi:glycoside hydrolase family 13 protein [Lewinella sp. LCG006]|uniref:glycoside hydrolase family 13 protein n=1 Tax=Lewinella sp. LCG006 TaxID=3231911 RepID=UPI00345F3A8B